MSQYGITKARFDANGALEQVMLHAFKKHIDPERADVELDAGVATGAPALSALLIAGNEVYVMDEVAPRLTDEADPVRLGADGSPASFDRFGKPSAALRSLPSS